MMAVIHVPLRNEHRVNDKVFVIQVAEKTECEVIPAPQLDLWQALIERRYRLIGAGEIIDCMATQTIVRYTP